MTSPKINPPRIAAAIATYRRDAELSRLLGCLAAGSLPVDAGAFVADNADSPETRALCSAAPLPCAWIGLAENLGPGAAWNAAIARALEDPGVTHLLVLDDDVVMPPGALGALMETMNHARAAAVAPLLFDNNGRLWGFPEPEENALRKTIRRIHTPGECAAALGTEAHRFCWATGACMLYARTAFETCGFFREDFWMLGEDLEFSMRVAAAGGGVFTGQIAIPHLPPPPRNPRDAKAGRRGKFLALLQNLSFLAFHSPHSAHLRRYLPGNLRRYLRTEGWTPGNMRDAAAAFRLGAVKRQPAGTLAGAALRARAGRRPERVWSE